MQHAVHNRATIRAADRTDVSGRVTAGSINDRSRVKGKLLCGASAAFAKCALLLLALGD
jgi:hypothetical protein